MSKNKRSKPISRRGFLGAGVLIPFLGVAHSAPVVPQGKPEDEYTTMLTAKGDVVRVKKNALKNARIVEKKMSNKSLLDWLKLKG